MLGPNCPDHGDELLLMAAGRLDDERASAAERLVVECPACRRWWDAVFAGPTADEVDRGVRGAWAELKLPRRSRRRWLAVAAAVVAAAGLTATLSWLPFAPNGAPDDRMMVSRVFDDAGDEASDLNRDGRTDAADLALALQRRN